MTIVESELLRIYHEHGTLTAALVVAEAIPEDAPLHGHFEWDDTRASERFRLVQASSLIRSHKVRITRMVSGEPEVYQVRQWVPASRTLSADAEPGRYQPVDEIDSAGRTVLLQRMRREINAMRLRYAHLEEFWSEIDQMQKPQAS
jgi:hypothetical protein